MYPALCGEHGDVKAESAGLDRNALDLRIVIEEQNAAFFKIELVGDVFRRDREIKRGEAHIVKSAVSAVFGEGHHAGNGTFSVKRDDIGLEDIKGKLIACHSVFAKGFVVTDLNALAVAGHCSDAGDADIVLLRILPLAANDVGENFDFYLLFFFHCVGPLFKNNCRTAGKPPFDIGNRY